MRQRTLIIFLTLFSFLAFSQVAEAKRFGFGGSYGYSKRIAPKQANTPRFGQSASKSHQQTAAGGRATSGASRWLGPLAGLAAGGLLASLFFGDGFQGLQILDFLLIGGAIFLLIAFLRRKKQSQPFASHASGHSPFEEAYSNTQTTTQSSYQTRDNHQAEPVAPSSNGSGSIIGSALNEEAYPVEDKPAWFDEAGFIENAKTQFVAVQKAWDAADLTEIKSYCTDELFQALKQEMGQMHPGDHHTEVEEVRAEIVQMAIEGEYFVVSVAFSGFIKEEKDGLAHAFNEIWHIKRDASDQGNWLIAGIQQSYEG